jgi:hypothetical protein
LLKEGAASERTAIEKMDRKLTTLMRPAREEQRGTGIKNIEKRCLNHLQNDKRVETPKSYTTSSSRLSQHSAICGF